MKLEPLIQERQKRENLSTLTFEELYAPLNRQQKKFLKKFQNLDAKKLGVKIPFRGFATGKERLTVIKGQKVKVKDKEELRELPPQFLPPPVYTQYLKMMKAMQKDIGVRLYIESGYRSSAYQLYLFVYYLQNHDYSIRETVKFVALPGYSEHGSPQHQAIDFINKDGINGEDNPKEFEDLKEYQWLLKNAKQYGFVLSYPKDSPVGITYEPWHWRYEKEITPTVKKDLPLPGFYPISKIKKYAATSAVFQTEGYVVKIYTCPPCPSGAQCKPCMPDNIVISENNKVRNNFDQMSDQELIIFTEKTKVFHLGKKYRFIVKILSSKLANQSINDVELIDFHRL